MPEIPFLKKTSLIALISATALAITGCAELPAPSPTSDVNYRACLVTEGANDALGVNEVADYAIKQAVVTFGVQRTAQKSSAGKLAANVNKLKKQGCDLIVLSGQGYSAVLDSVVVARPETNFVYIVENSQPDLIRADRDNLAIYQIDMLEAGMLTGHLAASMSELAKVAVACEPPGRTRFIQGLRAGVTWFNADNEAKVEFYFGELAPARSSMLIAVGCENDLSINGGGYALHTRVSGFGRDLYFNPKLAEQKSDVAATLMPNIGQRLLEVIASDLEGDFIGGSLGSTMATFGNGGLLVSPEHEVPYPANELKQLEQLALDYETNLK